MPCVSWCMHCLYVYHSVYALYSTVYIALYSVGCSMFSVHSVCSMSSMCSISMAYVMCDVCAMCLSVHV